MKKRILALLLSCVLCTSLIGTASAKLVEKFDENGNSIGLWPEDETPPVTPTHTHNYVWKNNSTSHWHACTSTVGTCDAKKADEARHTFDGKTCTVCGYTKTTSNPGTTTNPSNPSYNVTVPTTENGTAATDKTSAKKGDTVTITVTPDEGYQVDKVAVKDASGNDVEVKDEGDGKYSYVMPGSAVTVNVTFVAKPVENPFTDVADSAYYYDAVMWAVANGVTEGKTSTTFVPGDPCTRAQIVTFLWRAYGEIEPTTTENPFTDVAEDAYYYKAVLWAVENEITNGTNAEGTLFSPNQPCTRAQAVTFQYRAAKAEPVSSDNQFVDVAADAYYADAVNWAVANEITKGNNADGTTFGPDVICNRAQIVTFLYRELAE